MKALPLLMVVLMGAATTADASPREAMALVGDAIDLVTEEGGRCKKMLLLDLQDAEDMIRDRQYRKARSLIDELARDSEKCPRRVGRLLREARDELERGDRGDRGRDRWDRRRDRTDDRPVEPPPAPKRSQTVPWADYNADCQSLWMIVEIARYNTDDATLDKLAGLSGPACQSTGLAATSWPNGQTAKTSTGTFYYPNGQTAKTSTGTYYYPNGQTAKTSSGTWYYPNGQTARTSSNTWYYANGQHAGGYQLLVSDACTRAGAALCNRYKGMLASDVADWRTFAVVQLVALAAKTR